MELLNRTREYADLIGRAPFNELKQKLDEILADGQIDPDDYYAGITHQIQQLHGIKGRVAEVLRDHDAGLYDESH